MEIISTKWRIDNGRISSVIFREIFLKSFESKDTNIAIKHNNLINWNIEHFT